MIKNSIVLLNPSVLVISQNENFFLLDTGTDIFLYQFQEEGFQLETIFRGHTDKITKLQLVKNEKLLVSSSEDGSIRIWDISKAAQINLFQVNSCKINSFCLSNNNQTIFGCTSDGQIIQWHIRTGKITRQIGTPDKKICDIIQAPDNSVFYSTENALVKLKNFSELDRVSSNEYNLLEIHLLKNEGLLAVTDRHGFLFWDLRNGKTKYRKIGRDCFAPFISVILGRPIIFYQLQGLLSSDSIISVSLKRDSLNLRKDNTVVGHLAPSDWFLAVSNNFVYACNTKGRIDRFEIDSELDKTIFPGSACTYHDLESVSISDDCKKIALLPKSGRGNIVLADIQTGQPIPAHTWQTLYQDRVKESFSCEQLTEKGARTVKYDPERPWIVEIHETFEREMINWWQDQTELSLF